MIYLPNILKLRLLLLAILQSKDGVVVSFGLVCSSFVAISRGSTFRSYFLPHGDVSSPSVEKGNLLAYRTGVLRDSIFFNIYIYIYIVIHIYIYSIAIFLLVLTPPKKRPPQPAKHAGKP